MAHHSRFDNTRVKMFRGTSLSPADDRVNEWIEDTPDISIKDIKLVASEKCDIHYILVVYGDERD